ncbi:ARL14 effector protein-like isoform X2 [Neodiprion fabricii]|uniref:ARL14 effector protein-like isoform X2 n=1 Tax=Neodiprion fabricii TaxID=2872261 RepID=UPI001ED90C56|nr:ARL14 effector protein-like isoform X2 [Neodiprion fabricii]
MTETSSKCNHAYKRCIDYPESSTENLSLFDDWDERTRSAKKAALSLENGVQSFLKYFDPERSEREKRKLNRRLYPGAKKHVLYDEKGIFFQTGEDLCDCLERSCLGCHFPCPKCKSTKCGHECRSNRKWAYESIENEGSDVVIRNPVLKD